MKKYVKVENKNIEIHIYGNKDREIVLLPGWTHNFQDETKFITELSKNYQVISISYPGYMKSDDNKHAQSMKFLSKIVHLVVQNLELKNYEILGFSMGSQVALAYKKYYNKKAKCTLLSPPIQPVGNMVPKWGKFILSSQKTINFFRKSDSLKLFLINQAYKNIYTITEGRKRSIEFTNSKISLNGAFDTLIATLTSFINPTDFKKDISYIFGEKEILQNSFKSKFKTIKNSGHGDFNKHYIDLVKAIN